MANRPNRVGQQLGNYRLIGVLGEGGFAEVYLAEHIYLKTQVAIKVLQEKLEAQYVEGFLKEAQTIAALKHPHILRVLDFGMENSRPFLVMEYAPEGTLRKKHPRGSKVPLSTVVSYVKQVAMALQYAHDQKTVHRDVKPENVLVEADGKIVLGDFGIATPAHQTQSLSTQEAAGTVSYMAPEQIQGRPRAASDQYSLGIIVYEWLCGVRPFEGATAIEIAMHHLNDPPLPLREKMPTISPDIEHIVMTALAKDPKLRFASVQAFATALEQASQSGQSQPSVSPRGNIPPSQPLSPAIPVTPPNQSPQPTSDVFPVNRLSTLGQTSQSEQMQPSVPLAEATLSNQPLPPTILATPPNLPNPSSEPMTDVSPRSYAPHAPEVSGTQLPLPQPLSHPSRRMVIVGLVGLTLVGGGITWFATSRSSVSKSTPVLPIGTTLYTYRGHSSWVLAVVWSPDGKRIASSGAQDGTVQVWDAVDGGNVYTYRGHLNWVQAVAWSPDGKRIASSGSWDGTVQVWDAVDGGNVYTYRGHQYEVGAVAWSPNGKRIASGSGDNTVQVWDAVDGGNVYTYRGHQYEVGAVAWSPNGKRIASGSDDKTVQVWDAVDGGNVYTYRGHSELVDAIAWSPDGKRIASSSDDHTVQVWEAVDGGNVYTYRGHQYEVRAVAWSPDGKRIASGSDDHTVQVWVAS